MSPPHAEADWARTSAGWLARTRHTTLFAAGSFASDNAGGFEGNGWDGMVFE